MLRYDPIFFYEGWWTESLQVSEIQGARTLGALPEMDVVPGNESLSVCIGRWIGICGCDQ